MSHRLPVLQLVSSLFATVILAACGPHRGTIEPHDLAKGDKARANSCDVTLQIYNTYDKTTERKPDNLRIATNELCIKEAGKPLRFPSPIRLIVNSIGSVRTYELCREGTVSNHDKENVSVCEWNGSFRDQYPFNFRLRSYRQPLNHFVQAVRVLRNGRLVYAWLGTATSIGSQAPTNELTLSGRSLTDDLVPQDAEIDLRIIPTGVEVDTALIETKVVEKKNLWKRQLSKALGAVATSPTFAGGALDGKLACFKWRAELIAHQARRVAGEARADDAPPEPKQASCPKSDEPAVATNVTGLYEKLKDRSIRDVRALDKVARAKLESYADAAKLDGESAAKWFKQEVFSFWQGNGPTWNKLDAAGDGSGSANRASLLQLYENNAAFRQALDDDATLAGILKDANVKAPSRAERVWLKTRGTWADLQRTLQGIDDVVQTSVESVDEAVGLYSQLRKDAVRLSTDTTEQADLFFRMTEQLNDESIFDQYTPNPAPLSGEQSLDMEYSDPFQLYFLAVWNAAPIRVTTGEPDFGAGNLIPILDAGGMRVQWSTTRFADIRLGLGFSYLSHDVTVGDEPEDVTVFNFAPQANLSLGGFKVGTAYAATNAQDGFDGADDPDRWRILVGADLVKLVSGRNFEADAF